MPSYTEYGKNGTRKMALEKWHLEIMVPLFFGAYFTGFKNSNYLCFSVYFSETKYMYMCIINFIIPSHTKNLYQTINLTVIHSHLLIHLVGMWFPPNVVTSTSKKLFNGLGILTPLYKQLMQTSLKPHIHTHV